MARPVTQAKIPGFDRQWRGVGPHYEVWYGKVDIPDERALWFRYKTLDGAIQEASCWAVWFDGDEMIGGKKRWWLDDLDRPGPVAGREPSTEVGPPLRFQGRHATFRVDDAHLDDGNALGSAGDITWDLHWRDSGRRYGFVPPILETLGLAQSTYESCFCDLRVGGRVRVGDEVVEFADAPGMVGHIQGSKIAGHSWAWSHCNNFDDDEDAVFEGLSARALIAGRGSPLMTALVLFVDGRRYAFHGPLQVFRTSSHFDRRIWRFSADDGELRLTGEARAGQALARVRYIDTDGSDVWCSNTKLGTLELHFIDRLRGRDKTLYSSGRAAYETVTREPPIGEVLV